jgi:hypothetical protein
VRDDSGRDPYLTGTQLASRWPPRLGRLTGMAKLEGFTFELRKDGDVVIHHYGRLAAALRGRRAVAFTERVSQNDEPRLMAPVTGSYRRGSEGSASAHPRNQLR